LSLIVKTNLYFANHKVLCWFFM